MTPETQRIAIAKACGWTNVNHFQIRPAEDAPWFSQGTPPDNWNGHDTRPWLPDFLNSLDAMDHAEKSKDMHWSQQWAEYVVKIALREAAMDDLRTDGLDWVLLVARLSAAQRAEALLRTLNLWTE